MNWVDLSVFIVHLKIYSVQNNAANAERMFHKVLKYKSGLCTELRIISNHQKG